MLLIIKYACLEPLPIAVLFFALDGPLGHYKSKTWSRIYLPSSRYASKDIEALRAILESKTW